MKARWLSNSLNTSISYLAKSKIPISPNPSQETRDFRFVLNYVDISRILSICGRERYLRLGCSLHACIIKNFEYFDLHNNQYDIRNLLVVWNSLLSMYLKCGNLSDAVKLFDHMPLKDTVSWNSMVSGFLRIENFQMGFGYFKQLHELSISRFDQATLTTILSVCDEPNLLSVCSMIHCLVFLNGYEQEVSIGNALITSYFKCLSFNSGSQVFDEMTERNVITWTAMISGLAHNQFYEESLCLFLDMCCGGSVEPNSLTYLSSLLACSGLQALKEGHQIHGLVLKLGILSDLFIKSALMDLYSKCGNIEDSFQIFESAEEFDEVSMTVMLVGLAQNGLEKEAMKLFVRMINGGIEIDPNMVSAVLGVFGVDTSMAVGKQVHSLIIKRSFGCNPFVSNSLINMYSKSGDLEESIKVFDRMSIRNSISWNSMIAAFARHGNGTRALELYEEMTQEGAKLTDVTFLSLLHACSHVGSIRKGMEFLESMVKVHGISPRMEHYACIVDMLGRAGRLNEAKSFIEGLPMEPGVLIWQTLLGACSIHGDSEMGKYAANCLLLAVPESPTPYILMANIYSSEGKWAERARIIKRMKETGVTKDTGRSWIEVHKEVHSFVVEDRVHPEAKVIYEVLAELFRLMRDEGYVPDKRFLLYDLDLEVSRVG